MADSTPAFQPKTVQPKKFAVAAQKDNVVWVEGRFTTYQHPGFHNILMSVAPGDKGVPDRFKNRYFTIERIGDVEKVGSVTTKQSIALSDPVIHDPGAGYRVGDVVSTTLPHGMVRYVVRSVNNNGGITAIDPVDPNGLKPDEVGNFALSAPTAVTGDGSDTENETLKNTSRPASFDINFSTKEETTGSSVLATPIYLAVLQGPNTTASMSDQTGKFFIRYEEVSDLDFTGQFVYFDGVAEIPSRI